LGRDGGGECGRDDSMGLDGGGMVGVNASSTQLLHRYLSTLGLTEPMHVVRVLRDIHRRHLSIVCLQQGLLGVAGFLSDNTDSLFVQRKQMCREATTAAASAHRSLCRHRCRCGSYEETTSPHSPRASG
jgi:hypothetical protein